MVKQMNKLLVLSTLAIHIAASTASADIIYRETFSSTVNNNTLSSWAGGWSLHRNTTGGGVVGNATGTAAVISNSTGRPSDVAPINGGTYAQDVTGLAFGSSGDMVEGLFFTSEYTWDAANLTDIKWYMGNGATSVQQRAALQVGTQWYVSAVKSGSSIGGASNFAGQATQQTVLKADNWFALSYVVGDVAQPFSISGTATALPTGTVTAMGIFTNTYNAGNSRFDTFEVNAIPEPSTLVLVGISLLGVVFLRRRR
jgi:hypothetical protein